MLYKTISPGQSRHKRFYQVRHMPAQVLKLKLRPVPPPPPPEMSCQCALPLNIRRHQLGYLNSRQKRKLPAPRKWSRAHNLSPPALMPAAPPVLVVAPGITRTTDQHPQWPPTPTADSVDAIAAPRTALAVSFCASSHSFCLCRSISISRSSKLLDAQPPALGLLLRG